MLSWESNSQIVHAMFGRLPLDSGPTVLHDGSLDDAANPWAKQFYNDLQMLASTESESMVDSEPAR